VVLPGKERLRLAGWTVPMYDAPGVAADLVASRPIRKGDLMAGSDPQNQRAILVVARGQGTLLEALRELCAELGWVDVIEDRRQGFSLLPRTDRQDTPEPA